MATVVKVRRVNTIKPGPRSTVRPDGTIINPVSFVGIDVTFDDGVTIQVEQPVTSDKVRVAYEAAATVAEVDGIRPGMVV
jgi:hypothetical protein